MADIPELHFAKNLFSSDLETVPAEETMFTIFRSHGGEVERIVSPPNHASPECGWYDQERHEWVLVLSGWGRLVYEDGTEETLMPGDHTLIRKKVRHRVAATSPNESTVWLAMHFDAAH